MKHYPMNGDCNFRMGGERMHEHACTAASAAHCAGEQGKFWEMHDLLYDNQQDLGEESYKSHAQSPGWISLPGIRAGQAPVPTRNFDGISRRRPRPESWERLVHA